MTTSLYQTNVISLSLRELSAYVIGTKNFGEDRRGDTQKSVWTILLTRKLSEQRYLDGIPTYHQPYHSPDRWEAALGGLAEPRTCSTRGTALASYSAARPGTSTRWTRHHVTVAGNCRASLPPWVVFCFSVEVPSAKNHPLRTLACAHTSPAHGGTLGHEPRLPRWLFAIRHARPPAGTPFSPLFRVLASGVTGQTPMKSVAIHRRSEIPVADR